MTISTNRESDRFIIRLPEGMRDRIKAAAAENNRSMNAEIVARLETSFATGPDQSNLATSEISKAMKELGKQLNEVTAAYRSTEFREAMQRLTEQLRDDPTDD